MRKKIVAGNWKMNKTAQEAFVLATEVAELVKSSVSADVQVIMSGTVLAIGEHATAIAADWAAQIAAHRPDANPRVHLVDDIEAARRALHDDLADAVVGWRLLLAGPAHACLRVRADALEAGAADDEITVASTEVATREIYCAHCRTVTLARIELTGTLPCLGCGRELFVYYHVSRRLGTHLGFASGANYRGTS